MTDNLSLFQRLVNNDEVDEMLDDLNNLEDLVPGDDGVESIERWELAMSFGVEDVPDIIEELEELADDEP